MVRKPQEVKVSAIQRVWGALPEIKMLMDVYAKLPSGRGQVLHILIDTGAEANLVREGLLPRSEFSCAGAREEKS